MAKDFTLKRIPSPPEYLNSAGRLLRLLELLRSNASYYDVIAKLYGHENPNEIAPERKGELYLDFMQILSSAYRQFWDEVNSTAEIPDATKPVIASGLSKLIEVIYPANSNAAPQSDSGRGNCLVAHGRINDSAGRRNRG